jgi:Uma2 family endonuclease
VHFPEGYRLLRAWRIPDVSAIWADQREGDGFEGAPTIAIKIVSACNSAEAIDRKTEAYLEEGAAEVWIVYPAARTMKLFRKDGTSICVTGIYACALIGFPVNLQKLLPAA